MSPDLTALMSEHASTCGPSPLCFHSSSCHLVSASVPPPFLSPLSVSRSIIVQLSLANICSFLWHHLPLSLSLYSLLHYSQIPFRILALCQSCDIYSDAACKCNANASKKGKNIHNCIYLFSIIAAMLITGNFFGKSAPTLTKNTFFYSFIGILDFFLLECSVFKGAICEN